MSTRHQCDTQLSRKSDGWGDAIDDVYIGENGLWMAGNREYGTEISFCPFCGEKLELPEVQEQ